MLGASTFSEEIETTEVESIFVMFSTTWSTFTLAVIVPAPELRKANSQIGLPDTGRSRTPGSGRLRAYAPSTTTCASQPPALERLRAKSMTSSRVSSG